MFSIDLSQNPSRWENIYNLPANLTTNLYRIKLYSCEEKNELYLFTNPLKTIHSHSNSKVKMYRSQNEGQTFKEIELPSFDQVGQAKPFSKGLITVAWKKTMVKMNILFNFFYTDSNTWRKVPLTVIFIAGFLTKIRS